MARAEASSERWNRRLGEHVGIGHFSVNVTRLVPGARSAARHAHGKRDELVCIVSGEVVLETNDGTQTLRAGMCAGCSAGCGDAHRFANRPREYATLLVIGDRRPFDEIAYPDIDNRAKVGAGGRYVFTRKEGAPHDRHRPTLPIVSLRR